MTATATLLLADSGTPAPGCPSAETALLGLPLVRRTALAARRAGFDLVYVLGAEAGSPALDGTGARAFPRDGGEAALPAGRIVLLPDRAVASTQWLRAVREIPLEPGRIYRLGTGAVVQTPEPASLVRALARPSPLPSIVSEWTAVLRASPSGGDVAPDAGIVPPLEVTTRADLAAAETHLLKGLVKKEDGILTRYVSRKISLAVTRRLAPTRVTPNAMTVVSVALGLAGAWSFLSPTWPRQAAGGLLFLLHSILDGCDGELARLKFQESRLGGVLDFWGDNFVHVAVFSAFGIAWSAAIGEPWPLYLAALAVSGTVLCAGFIYTYAMRPRPGGGPLLTTVSPSRRSKLTQVLDALARRDFIYFVMVLALFGKAYWFLAPVSAGTPGFFLALLVMALGGRRLQGAPGPGRSSPQSAG
jgi:phosphatidylglycerophosphate synthase